MKSTIQISQINPRIIHIWDPYQTIPSSWPGSPQFRTKKNWSPARVDPLNWYIYSMGSNRIHGSTWAFSSGWWLGHPSEKYESQLGWLFPICGKIKNVPNHQPDIVVSTTNQRIQPLRKGNWTLSNERLPHLVSIWPLKKCLIDNSQNTKYRASKPITTIFEG